MEAVVGICEAAGAWVLPAAAGAGAAGDPAKSAAAAWGAACALSSSLRSAHCTAAGMAQQQACGEGTWGSTDAASTALPSTRDMRCGSASPQVALGQPADSACWPAEPAPAEPLWRQRSLTPDDAPISEEGPIGPITPATAPSRAAASPMTVCTPVADSADAACEGAAVAKSADSAQRVAAATALWRRCHSFMSCVADSALVQSALLSLELAGTHPAAAEPALAGAAGLDWTLAQLLAMHVKAGLAEATEHSVLASLWLLESMESVWRSPATVCLNDYLKHLAVFSPEAVVEITADWKGSFRRLRAGVVGAQMDLLQRLDWRVSPDFESEVRPSRDLLFRLSTAGAAAATPTSLRDRWAAHMHLVVERVQHKAHVLSKQGRLASQMEENEAGEQRLLAPIKRQRI